MSGDENRMRSHATQHRTIRFNMLVSWPYSNCILGEKGMKLRKRNEQIVRRVEVIVVRKQFPQT